jgi:acetoin utilization protein AcuB
MLAQALISPNVPCLDLSDTANKALSLMEDYHLTQLPLVSNNTYLGLVEEDKLLDWDDTSIAFANAHSKYNKPSVQAHTHVYDAVKIFQEFNLVILPVINAEGQYLGAITAELLLQYISNGTMAKENGGIIVIQATPFNFSISQIARIFESENVNVLSILVHNNTDNNNMFVTIKTNKQDLRAIVATLDRLGYIVAELHSTINDLDDLKTNFDGLMKYLNI